MKLEWRQDFETGDPATDCRNRNLIRQLGELLDSCRESMRLREAADFMSLLTRLLHAHFSAEEQDQAWRRYPHRGEHAQQHQSLMSRLATLQEAYLEEGVTMPVVTYSLKFSYEWLTWHIVQWDREMAVILNGRERSGRVNPGASAA